MNFHGIDGPPGAGKTTVCHELRARGYLAFDIDEDRLAQPVNKKTNKVTPSIESTAEWHAQHKWALKLGRVGLIKLASARMPVFLCGTITNNPEFWEHVDTVTYLRGDEPTIDHRLATRTNNSFGKKAAERQLVLGNMGSNYQEAVDHGALVVNAKLPVRIVADIAEINAINSFTIPDPAEVRKLQEMVDSYHPL